MHSKKTRLYLSIIFSILSGHFAMAQDLGVSKEISKIDNLIYYNQFNKAEKKADSLYKILKADGDEKYLPQLLELRYQKALTIDNQFDHGNALPIFMEVLEGAEANKLYNLSCRTNIRIAFNHEKANNYYIAYKYLNAALKICREHNFTELESTIYIRYSLIHRFLGKPEILGLNEELTVRNVPNFFFKMDSAFYYAEKAIRCAKKFNNEYDIAEATVTLGILESKHHNNYEKSIQYYSSTIPYWKKVGNEIYAGMMYNNIVKNKLLLKDFKAALQYSDSSYRYYDKTLIYYKWNFPSVRSEAYEKLKNIDSAYYYLKIAYKDEIESYKREELIKTKNLEEQYENDKKEATIQSKDKQMLLVGTLLAVIVLGSILLFRQNRKINSRNRIINKQLAELSKTLEQKQVLLSELQHRVKNNLQHVISILEIQKESVDFNNIDELIRGNQNRIHSMALLHKKLNISDSVNEVSLEKYLAELSQLVKESYDTNRKKVTLSVKCDIDRISIEKALPLGLIIVELISNSMKYAFKKQHIGIINISLTHNGDEKHLYYSDNGVGFDFHKVTKKGLGLEIINGLIDQIDGTVKTKSGNGFELNLYFR